MVWVSQQFVPKVEDVVPEEPRGVERGRVREQREQSGRTLKGEGQQAEHERGEARACPEAFAQNQAAGVAGHKRRDAKVQVGGCGHCDGHGQGRGGRGGREEGRHPRAQREYKHLGANLQAVPHGQESQRPDAEGGRRRGRGRPTRLALAEGGESTESDEAREGRPQGHQPPRARGEVCRAHDRSGRPLNVHPGRPPRRVAPLVPPREGAPGRQALFPRPHLPAPVLLPHGEQRQQDRGRESGAE